MSRSQLELQSVDVTRKRRGTGKWPLISWATTIASPGRDKTKAIFQLDSYHFRQSLTHVSQRQSSSLPTVWSCPAQLKTASLLRLACREPKVNLLAEGQGVLCARCVIRATAPNLQTVGF
ncbi:unnamed protein product [Effrenium voratum]|uniref:Uncharacterized protein n=1 Tax=Effrenium voratum TaxID=2562239 RepID=A0AA36IEE1_9DINO|nr:unnamed protein product [Effrenium voratum]